MEKCKFESALQFDAAIIPNTVKLKSSLNFIKSNSCEIFSVFFLTTSIFKAPAQHPKLVSKNLKYKNLGALKLLSAIFAYCSDALKLTFIMFLFTR